jgi:DoxX-like family
MTGTQPKAMTWTGWVITVLIVLMMTASGTMKILNPPQLAEQFTGKFGYPGDVTLVLGIVEISCAVLYLIPPTAILGAILLTGYLGGAIATHVRIHDDFSIIPPAVIGVFVWLAVFLRDPRVRALLPLRRSSRFGSE